MTTTEHNSTAIPTLPTWRGYSIDERLRQFRKGETPEFLDFDSKQGMQVYQEVFLAPLTAGDTVQLTLSGLTRDSEYKGRIFTVAETPPGSDEGIYALSGFADWLFVRSELLRCDAPSWAEELAPAKPVSILVIEVRCPVDGHICIDQFGSQHIQLGTNPVRCTLCKRLWSVPQNAFARMPHHFARINAPIAWRDEHLLELRGARFEACEREVLTTGTVERELIFPMNTHLGSVKGPVDEHLVLSYHYTLPGPLSCTLCEWVFGEARYNVVSWVRPPKSDLLLVVALVAQDNRVALERLGAEISPWPAERKRSLAGCDAQSTKGARGVTEDHPLIVRLPKGTKRLDLQFLGSAGHQLGEGAPTYVRQTDFRLPDGSPWQFVEAVVRTETDGSLFYSARFFQKEAVGEEEERKPR